MVLTDEQRASAFRDGFVLVEDVLSAAECEGHLSRLDEYVHGRRVIPEGMRLQQEPQVARGDVSAGWGESVRKISGMASDELFWSLITRPTIVAIIQELLSEELRLFRADVLMKPARVGSAKGAHQDSPYWPIDPMDLWSCWLTFDPATLTSGCMEVVPGSHRGGALRHEQVTDDYVIPKDEYGTESLVPAPMRAGSGLFFHSLLVHRTAANTSAMPRRAITMSYLGSRARYTGEGPGPDYPKVVAAGDPVTSA